MKKTTASGFIVFAASLIIGGCGQNPMDPSGYTQQGKGKPAGTIATCMNFMQISHCPVGQANLTLTSNSLIVNNLTSPNNGVLSSFAATSHWSQAAAIDFGTATNTQLTYSTLSSGNELMSLNIQKGGGNQFSLLPNFTGSSQYRIQVYNGTALVAEQDNVDAGLGTNIVIVWPDDGYTENYTEAGRANIVIVWPDESVAFTLPNGNSITGNRIQLSAANPSTPTFNQVRVTGTAASMEITNESAQ